MTVVIRPESPGDEAAIADVTRDAFGHQDEARLTEALRAAGTLEISLVAEDRGHVIGHIAFSPVTVAANPHNKRTLGLGPMAVAPQCQGDGIGSRLVRDGIEAARAANWDGVVVLGDPGFYGRFGFVPGPLSYPGAPPEAFMALALNDGGLNGLDGEVRYHPAFDEVS